MASLFTDNSGENAHRMAACWNACAGLDVDLRARFGLGTATGSSICRLREQNAELIEALQSLFGNYALQSVCIHQGGDDFGRVLGTWGFEAEQKARAALEKATGEPQ